MKNKLLKALLIFTFIKSLAWVFFTPVFQAPDENIHYSIIHYIGQTNRHPGKKNSQINSLETINVSQIINFNWQAHHPVWRGLPPDWRQQILALDENLKSQFVIKKDYLAGQKLPQAYFWLNFPLYLSVANQNFLVRFYFLRFFSVVLGTITVYLSFLLAQLLFKHTRLSLAVAALVAFQPMASVIFSSITYDALAILTASLYLYLALKFLKTKKNRYQTLSFLVGIIAITVKTQLIGLILTWPFLLKKSQRKLLLLFISGLAALATLKDYQEIITQGINWLSSGQIISQFIDYFTINAKALWAEVFPWYWGVFGWLEKVMPLLVYRILKLVTGFSLLGLISFLYRQLKSKSDQYQQIKFLIVFSLITALVVFINDFLIFTRTGSHFGVQGRYFLPAVAAHMLLLTFGLTQLIPKKYLSALSSLLIIISLGLNLIGLYTLYQFFGNIWS